MDRELIGAGLLAVAALLLAGCGGGAIQTQARAATVTASVLHAGVDVATDARRASLARVEAETEGQPVADRLEALRAERARWSPLGASLDAARQALLTWVASLELALAADEDEDTMPSLLQLALRVVLLYDQAAELAAALGADLPQLPEQVTALAASVGGE
jgi:hypothetical protein